jgi:hypothetical protein
LEVETKLKESKEALQKEHKDKNSELNTKGREK